MVRKVLSIIFLTGVVGCGDRESPPPPPPLVLPAAQAVNRPIVVPSGGYVGSASCRQCHEREYATWHDSYHRTMTQVVSPQSVAAAKAPLDDAKIEMLGVDFALVRRGDEYFLQYRAASASTSGGGAGAVKEKQVVLSTGSHRFQIYWVESGQSREIGTMPFLWLIEDQRWVPTNSIFIMPPTEPWRNEHGRWTRGCSNCHTTHPRPRRTGRNTFDTHVSEFGISCEACHGPGETHAKDESADSIVHPAALDHRRSAQVCGQCHGISGPIDLEDEQRHNVEGKRFRPGDDLHQVMHVTRGGEHASHPRNSELYGPHEVSIPHMFWSDGMVRVSGREYNGMIESPCFQRGEMDCLSCHQLHQATSDPRPRKLWADDQLQPKMRGDQACLQCHDDFADNIENHTHHPANSAGSRCMNCHMPFTTYGLMKSMRSHTISNPSAKETVDVGRPNACNQCHIDQTLQWTDKHMQAWYGHDPVELSDDQKTVPATALWMLTGDAGMRALAAWTAGWDAAHRAGDGPSLTPYLGHLLDDPYDCVRYIAYRSLRSLVGDKAPTYDFVGPPEARKAAATQVTANAPHHAAKLIERLTPLRNDNDVWLLE